MSTWEENFANKCLTCEFSSPTTRRYIALKHQLTCNNPKAINRGLNSHGYGGGFPEMQVHKLFGCIYWTRRE